MHLRFSIAVGTPVMDDETSRIVARISDILINPDNGKVVGFFVDAGTAFPEDRMFLSSADIVAWGTIAHIRYADAIVPAGDIVRLRALLDDPRGVLGQSILSKATKRFIGVCKDVQFDTRHMTVEWLFPRKYLFFTQAPVPVREIVEITPQAIFIKEQLRPHKEPVEREEVEMASLKEVLPVSPSPS